MKSKFTNRIFLSVSTVFGKLGRAQDSKFTVYSLQLAYEGESEQSDSVQQGTSLDIHVNFSHSHKTPNDRWRIVHSDQQKQ